MREIKFRAWRKDQLFGSAYIYGIAALLNHNENPEKYELEQYTGLHDKNGQEIYEGDIAQIKKPSFTRDGKIQHNLVFLVVSYSEYAEWLLGGMTLSREFKRCKVIGNIHENPELLEKN